jgi:hypothetical protein
VGDQPADDEKDEFHEKILFISDSYGGGQPVCI